MMWVGTFGILLTATLAASQPTLFAVIPNLMRFDSLEKITLEYHKDAGGNNNPAQVKVSLQNYPDKSNTFSIKNVAVTPGTQKIVRVKTKLSDLRAGSLAIKNYIYVRVECAALNFDKSAIVLLTGTKGFLFLQTDKPIYLPEQEVHIRAVSLNPEMLPAKTDIVLDVLNPNQTIFMRYEGKATKGFFTQKVKLPDVTLLGNWTVKATYKNRFQSESQTSQVAFEVKEYVLPTFSVDIKAPKYILLSENEVQVTITSRHVWKEDVRGRLTVVFSLAKKDGSISTLSTRTFSNFNGKKVIALPKNSYINKNPQHGYRLIIDATVTEAASGNQETNSDSSAMFAKSPYKISLARTPKNYKPDLPFMVKVDVRYASGEIASDVRMAVTATAKERGRHGRIDVLRNDAQTNQFSSNKDGQRALTLDIPPNTEDVKIKIETVDPNIVKKEQAVGEMTLKPMDTARNNFLSIQLINNPSRIEVDKKLDIRVDFTEATDKRVTFMVLARGKVVSLKSIAVRGSSKHESIQITPQMSPQARLLVYYVSKSAQPHEVIADSVVLEVEHKCGEELVLSHGRQDDEYRPADNVALEVESKEGAMVSLLAVDKSVYLLSERDILSRDKMFNTVKNMDISCGAGSGANVGEVFRDSGVYVLTNAVNVNIPLRQSAECPAPKSRRRRSISRSRAPQGRRIINALARYNEQDQQCCQNGFSEQTQQDSRSCEDIAAAKGLTNAGCKKAFVECCKSEREANQPTGRSGSDDEEEINEDDLDITRRDDFPEVWIDDLFEMTDDKLSLPQVLPDSITTWVVSGVSVSEDGGICVARPINITAKKEFFVNVDMPYAAIRGEQLEVKATVYNFGDRRIRTEVYMEADQSKVCFDGGSTGKTARRRLTLESKTGTTVTFPVVGMQVGDVDITVTALTNFVGDKVIKKLNVEAEGVRRVATISLPIDPEAVMGGSGNGGGNTKITSDVPNKRQTMEIPLKFPADAIIGTKRCRVSVSGSLLGPMVPSENLNLAKTIYQPTGCGEQTMIHMAPMVYSARYMLRTNTLTDDLEKRAYKFILSGYQRELMYHQNDGSFAAWHKSRVQSGSAWLTAFVAKVFCQASLFPNVGKQVAPKAMKAIKFLVDKAQKADGSFYEPRSVYHREMYGQNLKNTVVFTAFVVEAISKCGGVDGVDITSGNIARKLRAAVEFLNRKRDTLNKPYEQAILTYALAVQNSPHRFGANQKLRQMSSRDAATGMRYWTPDGTVVPEDTTPVWYKVKPSAYAIETASYALLAQLAIGGASEDYFQYAGPIASWLIRQRTIKGAFVSTTDTVIGLEALSDYAARAATRSPLNMEVRVFPLGNDMNQVFRLTRDKAYTPNVITENLPIDHNLIVEAKGSGIGQVQVMCQYNSPERVGEVCTFDLKVTSQEKDTPVEELNKELAEVKADAANGIGGNQGNPAGAKKYVTEIKAEFSYIGKGAKVGMSILEVTLFSGFRPVLLDLKSLVTNGKISRYEVTSSAVLMYLDKVTKGNTVTVAFRAQQDQKVKDVQPAAVKLYDYYEPDKHYCTKFYHPTQGSPLLATICNSDQTGRKVCQCAASACAEFWGFRPGKRPKLKTRPQLKNDACNTYDYAVKIRAGPVVVNGSLSNMEGTVEMNIKSGSQQYSPTDQMQFVWNSKCENPVMSEGTSYLVMGKDGANYVDSAGRLRMRYVLDAEGFVNEWYAADDKPRYNRALTLFAHEMIRDGCGL